MFLIIALCLLMHQEGEIVVLPTNDTDVFRLIYKADMKWNVVVKVLDDRGKERFKTEVKDSDSFLLPINMARRPSGRYTVEVSTPAYDLRKDFEYTTYEDEAAKRVEVTYDPGRHAIKLITTSGLQKPLQVYIYNERGDQLIQDDLPAGDKELMRIYSLDGAPATRFDVVMMMSGVQIKRELFDY